MRLYTPTWNVGALSSYCVLIGCVFGLLIGGSIAPPMEGEIWLKTYQGLIGALIGVIGVTIGLAVATYNVLRQMRINLMSREEDRIELALPGLRDAHRFLGVFCEIISNASSVKEGLRLFGLGDVKMIGSYVTQRLPRTDPALQEAVAEIISEIVLVETIDINWPEGAEASVHIDAALRSARQVWSDLQARIALMERRRPLFRKEIEEYFADSAIDH